MLRVNPVNRIIYWWKDTYGVNQKGYYLYLITCNYEIDKHNKKYLLIKSNQINLSL